MNKIRVLIADDHAVVRAGLKILIGLEPDLEIAGEAEDGKKAIELARRLKPDVVLLDVAMPQCNGAEATQCITRQSPGSRVLILSAYQDEDTVRTLLEAGAAGYLTKHAASGDLVQAIREVKRGNGFLSPAIARRLQHQWQHAFVQGNPHEHRAELTPRENEVLVRIAQGQANKQIGAGLGISIKTVEKHRQQVMEKLGIHDIAGLTRYAMAKGLLFAQTSGALTNPCRVAAGGRRL